MEGAGRKSKEKVIANQSKCLLIGLVNLLTFLLKHMKNVFFRN